MVHGIELAVTVKKGFEDEFLKWAKTLSTKFIRQPGILHLDLWKEDDKKKVIVLIRVRLQKKEYAEVVEKAIPIEAEKKFGEKIKIERRLMQHGGIMERGAFSGAEKTVLGWEADDSSEDSSRHRSIRKASRSSSSTSSKGTTLVRTPDTRKKLPRVNTPTKKDKTPKKDVRKEPASKDSKKEATPKKQNSAKSPERTTSDRKTPKKEKEKELASPKGERSKKGEEEKRKEEKREAFEQFLTPDKSKKQKKSRSFVETPSADKKAKPETEEAEAEEEERRDRKSRDDRKEHRKKERELAEPEAEPPVQHKTDGAAIESPRAVRPVPNLGALHGQEYEARYNRLTASLEAALSLDKPPTPARGKTPTLKKKVDRRCDIQSDAAPPPPIRGKTPQLKPKLSGKAPSSSDTHSVESTSGSPSHSRKKEDGERLQELDRPPDKAPPRLRKSTEEEPEACHICKATDKSLRSCVRCKKLCCHPDSQKVISNTIGLHDVPVCNLCLPEVTAEAKAKKKQAKQS